MSRTSTALDIQAKQKSYPEPITTEDIQHKIIPIRQDNRMALRQHLLRSMILLVGAAIVVLLVLS